MKFNNYSKVKKLAHPFVRFTEQFSTQKYALFQFVPPIFFLLIALQHCNNRSREKGVKWSISLNSLKRWPRNPLSKIAPSDFSFKLTKKKNPFDLFYMRCALQRWSQNLGQVQVEIIQKEGKGENWMDKRGWPLGEAIAQEIIN